MKKRIPAILALVLTAFFAWLALYRLNLADSTLLTSIEMPVIDWKFHYIRGPRPSSNEVVIVALDDETLKQLGSARTFERTNWARLVSKLSEAGPKAIGFDITFQDIDASDKTGGNDQKFADAIRSANSVVLGLQMDLEKNTGPKRPVKNELDEEMQQIVLEKQIFAAESTPPGSRPADQFFRAKESFQPNLPVLTKAAASFGFVNFQVDPDGRLRYQPQVIEYGGRIYPSLDIQLARIYLGAFSPLVNYTSTGNGYVDNIQIDQQHQLQTDNLGRLLIDYSGPSGTYQTVSMIDVMEGRVARDLIRNKIVLIGATSTGLRDNVTTPFQPQLPGVELHANIIENILHERYLFRGLTQQGIDFGIILLFGLILTTLVPRFDSSRSVFYTVFLAAIFTAFNFWAFIQLKWLLSFVIPGVHLVATSFTLISYKYLTEEREKKRTKSTFQSYLDPNVVEQVMSDPEKLKLGGEKRELTILFSDIRGFTSFSEKMAPQEVVHFLNQYFDKMQGIIFQHKGTLDKLIGDAVMCFWGHPLDLKDHPLRGVVTALEMIKAVEELRTVLVLPGGARFEIGIGLNTGPMVVGNMGSQTRLSYTVMGDNVNLGSRLESLNKYYGTKIIISDTTFQAVRDMVFCRELDTIQVKGKSQAVTIYEPLGLKRLEFERRKRTDRRSSLTPAKKVKKGLLMLWRGERRQEERRIGSERLLVQPDQEEIATMYEHALELYRKGDFASADMAFDHVLSLKPGDGPSWLMKSRIAKYRAEYSSEGAHFDPVYKFDEK